MNSIVKDDKIITVPNILTVIRILLSPVFVILYFKEFEHHYIYATAVLLLSGLTDVLDGIIARKCNLITTLGKILDPVADKLTQAVIIVCLTINHYDDENSFLIYVLILLFAKEFTMMLGAIVLFKSGTRPSESKWWGKLGTVMIYVLFIATLLQDILTTKYISVSAINIISVITAICLVFSLFNYYPIFKEIQNGEYKFDKESHSK
ncbi:MAG: CDP-alcohol phosphatidyltransferase family protein [Acutalibacteraceae bacterium]